MAQTEFDALKMVQPDINGTARYMGMAGAFGALGGDASAIKDNPAGLGIYRTSEITGTLNILGQTSNSMWNGTDASDKLLGVGFNNFAYIKASPTYASQNGNNGLLSSNWSFSFNRLKNFDRNSTIVSGLQRSSITDYMAYFTGNIKSADLSSNNSPYDNTSVPWISVVGYQGYLIDENIATNGQSSWSRVYPTEQVQPSYNIQESGSIDEYSIGWAGNFGNDLFFGVNMNLKSVDYSMKSRYAENFEGGGGSTLTNYLTTTGAGFNLNVGAIYRPNDLLRLGLSVHSPTLLTLSDNSSANMDYYITSTTNGNFDTPSASNSMYSLVSPWRIDASAALILSQKGLLSAEYSNSFSTGSYFFDANGSANALRFENAGMKTMLKNVRTIKIGAEYKLTNNVSFRAGYANMSAGSSPTADKLLAPNTTRTDVEYFINNSTNFYTAGIGYREAGWYIDFAYVNKIVDETFYPYNSNNLPVKVNPADVKTTSNNVVFTVGLKF